MEGKRRVRSPLPGSELRRRYQEIGGLAALEQIQIDSKALDEQAIAVGPFARIDAGAVAARDGKTRGALTYLFGSQAAYQVAVMNLTFDAGAWPETIDYPAPRDFAAADAWVEALFARQSAQGPRHGAEPERTYASLWALWLSTLPYGLWSERVARPSMEEYERWVMQLEGIFDEALQHFGLGLREGVTLSDLACGTVSLTEGVWLNQCLTQAHPRLPNEPVSTALVRAGLMLWRGAVASE